jgi:L-ribulose-5-phosphate 3-epimerase
MTRREVLALMAAAVPVRAAARPVPTLCLFSGDLQRLEYSDIGGIIRQMGFDGVDLTVRPGGHVEPRLSNVDLVRAIEEMRGVGLEVPVITTALTTPYDPTMLPVVAIAGHTQIPLLISGFIKPGIEGYTRDIQGLVSVSARYGMAVALHNHMAENSGESAFDPVTVISSLDPRWAGLYFDPIHHGANWEAELKRFLPRLRAAAVKDFQIVDGQPKPCALGKGIVDLSHYFTALAHAGYKGPLSLRMEYRPEDDIAAITNDCAFARKKLDAAYDSVGSASGAKS